MFVSFGDPFCWIWIWTCHSFCTCSVFSSNLWRRQHCFVVWFFRFFLVKSSWFYHMNIRHFSFPQWKVWFFYDIYINKNNLEKLRILIKSSGSENKWYRFLFYFIFQNHRRVKREKEKGGVNAVVSKVIERTVIAFKTTLNRRFLGPFLRLNIYSSVVTNQHITRSHSLLLLFVSSLSSSNLQLISVIENGRRN